MKFRELIRTVVKPWVILGAIGFGSALLLLSLYLLSSTRNTTLANNAPTAVLTVVSLPTSTQLPPSPTPATPTTPTLTLPPPAPPGEISVGSFVQITGTGGDGLRLRTEPGLSSDVRFLGLDSEVFEIREGPQEIDGHTWWYLVAPFEENRNGWAVSGYLSVVQNP